MKVWIKYLIGLVFGVLAALILPVSTAFSGAVAFLTELFIRVGRYIVIPLIFTSIGRIDTISNAMELRGYGKYKKRTWYMGRKLQRNDYLCIALVLGFAVAALVITYHDGSRFYNPFI